MLIRAFSKLIVFIGPLMIVLYMVSAYYSGEPYDDEWREDYYDREDDYLLPGSEANPIKDDHPSNVHEGNEPDAIPSEQAVAIEPPLALGPAVPSSSPSGAAGGNGTNPSAHLEASTIARVEASTLLPTSLETPPPTQTSSFVVIVTSTSATL